MAKLLKELASALIEFPTPLNLEITLAIFKTVDRTPFIPLERTNDVNDEDEIEPTKSDNIVERAIDTADNTKELPEQQSLESIVEDQPQKQIEKKNRWIIKQYSNLPLEQLMDAPVDALWGISSEDKQLLKSAFNIKTVKDLATSKWFRMAEEIVDMANNQKD